MAEEILESASSIVDIIDSVYDPRAMQPENARANNVNYRLTKKSWQCLNLKRSGLVLTPNLYT